MIILKLRRFWNNVKWYCFITPWWYLFQKGNYYCPTCRSKLKKRYCKKCDIVFWRGADIQIINPKYKDGI